MTSLSIIVPCRGAAENLPALVASVQDQTDQDWQMFIAVDDCPDTHHMALELASREPRIHVYCTKRRVYALRNIVETVDRFAIHGPVGIIDGDDRLCNAMTIDYVMEAYEVRGKKIVWTQHTWDGNGVGCSGIPLMGNPYRAPWSCSHFRTFESELLRRTPRGNFTDNDGNWFTRAYDQALMLPLLYGSLPQEHEFIDEVCYWYNHLNSATPKSEHTGGQLEAQIARFIRQRGYVDKDVFCQPLQ